MFISLKNIFITCSITDSQIDLLYTDHLQKKFLENELHSDFPWKSKYIATDKVSNYDSFNLLHVRF